MIEEFNLEMILEYKLWGWRISLFFLSIIYFGSIGYNSIYMD